MSVAGLVSGIAVRGFEPSRNQRLPGPNLLQRIVMIFTFRRLYRELRHMSAATDKLAASVAALATSVDALLAKVAAMPPAEDTAAIDAAAAAVDAVKTKVDVAVAPHA